MHIILYLRLYYVDVFVKHFFHHPPTSYTRTSDVCDMDNKK